MACLLCPSTWVETATNDFRLVLLPQSVGGGQAAAAAEAVVHDGFGVEVALFSAGGKGFAEEKTEFTVGSVDGRLPDPEAEAGGVVAADPAKGQAGLGLVIPAVFSCQAAPLVTVKLMVPLLDDMTAPYR
ncbi:hypothetical protein SCACP_06770 [Sporomusa carbonis]